MSPETRSSLRISTGSVVLYYLAKTDSNSVNSPRDWSFDGRVILVWGWGWEECWPETLLLTNSNNVLTSLVIYILSKLLWRHSFDVIF